MNQVFSLSWTEFTEYNSNWLAYLCIQIQIWNMFFNHIEWEIIFKNKWLFYRVASHNELLLNWTNISVNYIYITYFFVNKMSLEHSHVRLFMYSLWLFQVMMTEFSSCDRDCMSSPKVKILTIWTFPKIICPSTPALDPWEVNIKLPFSLQTCHFYPTENY